MKLIRKLDFAAMAPRLGILCQALNELIENTPGDTECQNWGLINVRDIYYSVMYYIDLNMSGRQGVLNDKYAGTYLSIKLSDHVNGHISVNGNISYMDRSSRHCIAFPHIPNILLSDPIHFSQSITHIQSILRVDLPIAEEEIEYARSQHTSSVAFRWSRYYANWPTISKETNA